jgi:hypothetical protein
MICIMSTVCRTCGHIPELSRKLVIREPTKFGRGEGGQAKEV